MNRLLTPDGKMPFYLDDIRFLDDIYRNALNALCLAIFEKETNGFIVNGCNSAIAGSNLTISAGVIFYDNEFFEVEANSFNDYVQGKNYFFEIVEDETSLRAFGDVGVEHKVHSLRYAIISEADLSNENQTTLNALEA